MKNGNITGMSYFTSGSFGGGRSVIDQTHILGKITNGALIANPPAIGGVIFEGDLGEYSFSTKQVKHLKVFKLAEAVTDASTTLKFYRGDFNHVLEAGLNIMPSPADLETTGVGITVGAVTKGVHSTEGNIYSIAIEAATFGAGVTLAKGTLFVEAAEAGAAVLPLITNPNVAFSTDIPISYESSTSFTTPDGAIYPTPLYNVCTLWKSKASPIPASVLAVLRSGAFTDIKIFG